MTSTQRDLQARVARHAPSTGAVAEVVDEETTGPVPHALDNMPEWAARQSVARRTLSRRVDHACDRIVEHGARIAELEENQDDVAVTASGVRLAKHMRAALVAIAVLIPGTTIGAGKALLTAVQSAEGRLATATSERDAMRHDIDELRAELAALARLLRGDSP